MKYLGIDYGTKRVGIAISDDGGTLAFPKVIIPNTPLLMEQVASMYRNEDCEGIVIGESLDTNGNENKLMADIHHFADVLCHELQTKVFFEKEFMTSFEAHGRQGKESLHARQTGIKKNTELDAAAAALILQRFLDKHKNGK
ncbi:MAG: Holliday junction resolvase RuvX [Verrucomicrobiota bacterium]